MSDHFMRDYPERRVNNDYIQTLVALDEDNYESSSALVFSSLDIGES